MAGGQIFEGDEIGKTLAGTFPEKGADSYARKNAGEVAPKRGCGTPVGTQFPHAATHSVGGIGRDQERLRKADACDGLENYYLWRNG